MHDDRVLAALLGSPSTALVGASLDGVITVWSAGAEQMFGWPAGEAVGQPLSILFPCGREAELPLREDVLAGAALTPFETVRLSRDGSLVETEVHLLSVQDAEGRVEGTVALHRDLRRARRAEQALAASERELQARFEQSSVAQSRVDLRGRILAVNPAMQQLLGWGEEHLFGRNALDMFVLEDREELEQSLARLASGAEHYIRQDRTLLRADEEHRRVCLTVTAMRGIQGEVVLACSVEDVTYLRAAEQRVREQADRFDALLQTMPVAVYTFDTTGVCTSSRGHGLQRLGLQQDELVGTSLPELYAHAPQVGSAVADALAGREGQALVETHDGMCDGHYRPLRGADGAVVAGIGIGMDITQRATGEREVRVNEARLEALLSHAGDVVLVLDRAGRIVYVSPAVRALLGYDEAELLWQLSRDVLNRAEDHPSLIAAWRAVVDSPGASARVQARVRHADGSWRWADHVFTNWLDEPAVSGVVVNVQHITQQRVTDQEQQRLALHDPLTGLPNRALLLDRSGRAMIWAAQHGRQSGVVVLGVVAMAAVNDELGPEGGDLVLCSIAGRLLEAVRDIDSVARVGGDRFAVLVEDVASAEELRARGAMLLDAVEGPLDLADVDVDLRFRVGWAMTPAPSAGSLLTAAERSMSSPVGDDHGVLVVRASSEQAPDASATRELRRALERGELRLHFLPVLDLSDQSVAGVEALVRWEHPERGLLLPADFIPLAETSALIFDVGAWVLREACEHAARWQAAGRTFGVGINLSPVQMVDEGLLDLVRDVLRETGARGDRLVLEITESAVMDVPTAPDLLRRLRTMGIKLALDDFGTGYSSLTYLRRFPVDAIKIDRSFVGGLGRDRDAEAIVATIVGLGRAVGKLVVAEGVETTTQLHALLDLGVDQAQGFLWSPALSPDDLVGWLDDDQRRLAPAAAARTTTSPALADATAVQAVPDEPQILRLHAEGASLHTIAAALNAEGKRTAEGRRWTTTTVARVASAAVRRN